MRRVDELKDFLARTPFFAGLWDRGLEWVAQTLVERAYPAGAVVFAEGEDGGSMYVVKSGRLVARQGRCTELMQLGAGDFCGEMTLIAMQPRPYSVVVEEAAVLYELTNRDLYRLYQQDVKAYVLILQNLNRELCRRLRHASNRIAKHGP
jgi:CRP/FNR family cyclic AMP-dependent transcriptional regulator